MRPVPTGPVWAAAIAFAAILGWTATPAAAQDKVTLDDLNAGARTATSRIELPNNAGRFIPQPGLNTIEMRDQLEVVLTRLQAQLGDRPATPSQAALLPQGANAFDYVVTLARAKDKELALMQIGFRSFRSQPIHVWLMGINVRDVTDRTDMIIVDVRTPLEFFH